MFDSFCIAVLSRSKADMSQLHLDLYLPANKRVVKSVTLYGPIDPSTSSFRILSTKVGLLFVPADSYSITVPSLTCPGGDRFAQTESFLLATSRASARWI